MKLDRLLKALISSLLFWIILAVGVGVILGYFLNYGGIAVVVSINHIVRQMIMFIIPLVVFVMISSSITKVGNKGTKVIRTAFLVVIIDYVVAIIFGLSAGQLLRLFSPAPVYSYDPPELPTNRFPLHFDPLLTMSSAFLLALLVGIAILATRQHEKTKPVFETAETVVKWILKRFLMPLMPIFSGTTIALFVWRGGTSDMFQIIGITLGIIVGTQILFMAAVFGIASFLSKRNTFRLLKHYGGISVVAMTTMSSAITMNVVFERLSERNVLNKKTIEFGVPFFANTSFYGTMISVIVGIMGTSLAVYGSLPDFGPLLLFSIISALILMSSPGMHGGGVVAVMLVAEAVLGFGVLALALFFIIETLADPMSTVTNVISDGAALDAVDKKILQIEKESEAKVSHD